MNVFLYSEGETYASYDQEYVDNLNKEIERLSKEVTKYDEILCERNNEIDRLNNIIEEIEKWTKENNVNNRDIYGYEMEDTKVIYLEDFLDKLKALKEGKE